MNKSLGKYPIDCKVEVKSHQDGTTCLKWPVFVFNFGIQYDPTIFNLDATSFAEITALESVLVGFQKENCMTVNDVCSVLGKQLLSIVHPIEYGGVSFTFRCSLDTGDWSVLQKAAGNNNGGHKRCVLCGFDFSDHNSEHFFSYAHIISQVPKSLALSAQLFSSSAELDDTLKRDNLKELLGYKEIAAVLSKLSPAERKQLLGTVYKDCKNAIDNLHNVKGHLYKLIMLERENKGFNDPLFLQNLYKFLGIIII